MKLSDGIRRSVIRSTGIGGVREELRVGDAVLDIEASLIHSKVCIYNMRHCACRYRVAAVSGTR